MSKTCSCADGNHAFCAGKVSKWYAEPGDLVLETATIASDGVGVMVACGCSCHQPKQVVSIEAERVGTVREWVA